MIQSVAASGPTIWTNTYVLESTHSNRLLIEPSCWAQTVRMFKPAMAMDPEFRSRLGRILRFSFGPGSRGKNL